MELFIFGDREINHLVYAEVPWDCAKRERTDIDPATGWPMEAFAKDEHGAIKRHPLTMRPLMVDSDGSEVPVRTDVWVEARAFFTPFGPCCLSESMREEFFKGRDDVVVCHGMCCRQPVRVKAAGQARILRHYEGIRGYMTPASARMADLGSPFAGEGNRLMPDGSCVFWRPSDGKCAIHAFAVDNDIDWRLLKPISCTLFPMQVQAGLNYSTPLYYAMTHDPQVLRQNGIVCPIGSPNLTPAYLDMQAEYDIAFGAGFWEVMCDVFERHFRPDWESAVSGKNTR